MWIRRCTALALLAGLAATGAGPVAATGAEPPAQRQVSVSVATLWESPTSPRAIDAAAVAAPAAPARWLAGLTVAQRRALNGRVASQVLLGQRVSVVKEADGWSWVLVPGQPTPKDARGYPGWIPSAQLVASTPADAALDAVVTRPRAWLHSSESLRRRVTQVAYDTRLPVLAQVPGAVGVALPDGSTAWARSRDVAVVDPGESARSATRARLVAEARKFLGLQYLWGGTSGFGFDCSGLTHTVYAHLGVTIPRDAGPQFAAGRRVATVSGLRSGDLVFFRNTRGVIHHVGMYVGRGRMIHSPGTGRAVQYANLRSGQWAREFAGGRRYL